MQHKNQMKENNAAILSPGDKIHVMHRRRFEKDVRRHFVGEVKGYEQGVARASGYVFVIAVPPVISACRPMRSA